MTTKHNKRVKQIHLKISIFKAVLFYQRPNKCFTWRDTNLEIYYNNTDVIKNNVTVLLS